MDNTEPEAETCPVCYDPLDRLKTIQFGCGHRFCSLCATNWINDGHGTCAYCTQSVVDIEAGRFRRSPRVNHLRLFMEALSLPLRALFDSLADVVIVAMQSITLFVVALANNLKWVFLLSILWCLYRVVAAVVVMSEPPRSEAATTPPTRGEDVIRVLEDWTRLLSPVMSNVTRIMTDAISDIVKKGGGGAADESPPHSPVIAVSLFFHLVSQYVTMILTGFQLACSAIVTMQWPHLDWDFIARQPPFIIVCIVWRVVGTVLNAFEAMMLSVYA